MGSHPVNLAIRFLLEIIGLAALAWLGWQLGKRAYGYLFAIGFPLLAAGLWGLFAVPDDRSRSGEAVVVIPGILRFLLELGFFAVATWSFFSVGAGKVAWAYAAVVLAHYVASYDRVLWLVQQ